MDNISVIIRNRNEERYIGYAIQSVLDTFDKPEIVVVDNNSTDNSMGVVNMFKRDKLLKSDNNKYTEIKRYNMDSYTPGKSLNYGVTKCSNDYVLVLSAHSQIINCEVKKIKRLLNEHCVVGGKQIPIYKGKKITPRYVWSHFIDTPTENLYSNFEGRYFLHNAFSFFKRNFLVENPFDEKLVGKEDRYWINDMVDKGHNFIYDPINICHHHYTDNGATWKGVG